MKSVRFYCALWSLILLSVMMSGCSNKSTVAERDQQDVGAELQGEDSQYDSEVIELSRQNWERYGFAYTKDGTRYGIDVVHAAIPTNRETLLVAANDSIIFLQGRNFNEPWDKIMVARGTKKYEIKWDAAISDNYCVAITDPISYWNFVKMLEDGSFYLILNQDSIRISDKGRGIKYAIKDQLND